MSKKPKANRNLAKDVETKVKRTPIPEPARTQILQQQASLTTYISGVAAGLGLSKDWAVDLRTVEFVEQLK